MKIDGPGPYFGAIFIYACMLHNHSENNSQAKSQLSFLFSALSTDFWVAFLLNLCWYVISNHLHGLTHLNKALASLLVSGCCRPAVPAPTAHSFGMPSQIEGLLPLKDLTTSFNSIGEISYPIFGTNSHDLFKFDVAYRLRIGWFLIRST